MKAMKGWVLLGLAAGTAAGVSRAARLRRQQDRHRAHIAHKADVKAWENEGGNLAPAAR